MEEIGTGATIEATQLVVTMKSGKQVRLFVEWDEYADFMEFAKTLQYVESCVQYSVETIEVK